MDRASILEWFREEDPARLDELWRLADGVRRENVGDEVHLRGLVEISNFCARNCHYCGIRASNASVRRYRMTEEEILAAAHEAVSHGFGTIVMQSGEDYGLAADRLSDVICAIKAETPLAVTLSLGERPEADFAAWRDAGADRYLLRFETSNRVLYDSIHPPLAGRRSDRIRDLETLRRLGYQTGSGVMIGIPGQTFEDLADDILTFAELDLEMIGVGPYIPHPATPLGASAGRRPAPHDGQVPNSELMTYKVIALSRIVCPLANIPSTTALATLNRESGRELGLLRGANVVMPNLTPAAYRVLYELYPGKACVFETAGECSDCIKRRISAIGRKVGTGCGDSPGRRLVNNAAAAK